MKQLQAGDLAVSFKAKDINGNTIDLQDYKGKKVLLTFFRKASCPFCNMALQQLIRRNKDLKDQGINVITLFASPKDEVLKYAGKQKPAFPIIPDGDFSIYSKYGIEKSFLGMVKTMFNPSKVLKAMKGGFFSIKSTFQEPVLPADFLIDENQVIRNAFYGKEYDEHLPISEVLTWAA